MDEYYADDGCEFSPTCLTCPLPTCKYDWTPTEWAVHARANSKLGTIIRFFLDRGTHPIDRGEGIALSLRFEVSRRTIARARVAAGRLPE